MRKSLGRKSIDSMGYYMLYVPHHPNARKNGMVYEHILVAEEKLQRRIRDGEEVHHEDENKLNNHPDNLYVFASKEDHQRYHRTGVKVQVEDYWISPSLKKNCVICGEEFTYNESNRKNATYCSPNCQSLGRRKSERPTKEELYEMIKTKSFCEIGENYGVSDNAIRKWCKSYGLPYRKSDLKQL
jgi:hypothetical protein